MPKTKYDIRDALLKTAQTVVKKKELLTPRLLNELAKHDSEVAELMLLSKARFASDAILIDNLQRRWERTHPSNTSRRAPVDQVLSGVRGKLAGMGVQLKIDRRSRIALGQNISSDTIASARRRMESAAMEAATSRGRGKEIQVGRAALLIQPVRRGNRIVAVRLEEGIAHSGNGHGHAAP
jgi:hypothetical protein